MASVDDKLDRLLEEVASIKVVSIHHTQELTELKDKLEPVFNHVIGMRFMFTCIAGLVGVGTLVATVLTLFK